MKAFHVTNFSCILANRCEEYILRFEIQCKKKLKKKKIELKKKCSEKTVLQLYMLHHILLKLCNVRAQTALTF